MAKSPPIVLDVEDLACRRGERLVFRGLSLRLRTGECLAVRGANGSGKSSLLRMLAGLLFPVEGFVRSNGMDIHADLPAWRRQITWLGHQDGLKSQETPLEAAGFRLALSGSDADPLAALERMGMAAHARTPGRRLSAGQKRRVALAAAISGDASLWLIDEPTTGLDAHATTLFHAALETHTALGGAAVITTHDLLPPSYRAGELILDAGKT